MLLRDNRGSSSDHHRNNGKSKTGLGVLVSLGFLSGLVGNVHVVAALGLVFLGLGRFGRSLNFFLSSLREEEVHSDSFNRSRIGRLDIVASSITES